MVHVQAVGGAADLNAVLMRPLRGGHVQVTALCLALGHDLLSVGPEDILFLGGGGDHSAELVSLDGVLHGVSPFNVSCLGCSVCVLGLQQRLGRVPPASQTAMAAVAASKVATGAIAASATALAKIAGSTTALDALYAKKSRLTGASASKSGKFIILQISSSSAFSTSQYGYATLSDGSQPDWGSYLGKYEYFKQFKMVATFIKNDTESDDWIDYFPCG